MQKLIRGLHHFQETVFAARRDFFARLAAGQSPEALLITCVDSRIDPCLIMQAEPGDMLVLRNAGNVVPPWGAGPGGEAATVELGVRGLGVKHIVVCGHTHCGAMRALLDRSPASASDMPAVRDWLRHAEATRRIIESSYGHLEGNALLTAAAQENVLVQIENLRTHPALAARLARGEVTLHGWVYKIETGQVFAHDAESGQFLPIRLEAKTEPGLSGCAERAPAPLVARP